MKAGAKKRVPSIWSFSKLIHNILILYDLPQKPSSLYGSSFNPLCFLHVPDVFLQCLQRKTQAVLGREVWFDCILGRCSATLRSQGFLEVGRKR